MDKAITFFGGVNRVTGANFLFEIGDTRILIDCGMIQGDGDSFTLNKENFAYDPSSIHFLFVTHAHTDHIGRIPKLVKDGFKGKIFSTAITREITEIMLKDAARVAGFKADELGEEPLYGTGDVSNTLTLWETLSYRTPVRITNDLTVELFDAGHILGSSMYVFTVSDNNQETRVLFTGDLGNSPAVLIRDTENVEKVDYAIVDSVYGDRNHESKEVRDKLFRQVVEETAQHERTLLIPAFSLERTQVLLYELNELFENGKVKPIPVFLDSPLAIHLTEIYDKVKDLYKDQVKEDITRGDKIFEFPRLKETAKVWESKKIESEKGAKIIIAGSGMSTGGRILQHEKKYLPDENTIMLIVGYQAPGTLGRELEDGAKKVSIDDEEVEVRADIRTIKGFSSHKDSDHIVEFVGNMSKDLKKVFVVMGEPKSSTFLAQRLHDYLGINAVVPQEGKKYKI